MTPKPFLLHALSPLHVGVGQAADIVDLPIARQRATGLPYVPGSSIKGVLRDARRDDLSSDKWQAVFGPEREASEHAGALVVGDARLLALPVRSFRGTFAWVTSPLLLQLAQRDLDALAPQSVPQPATGRAAVVGTESLVVYGQGNQARLYLEDLDLPVRQGDANVDAWAKLLSGHAWSGEPGVLKQRLAVVDDETMTFLWETATQLDTRVSIDSETRTAKGAALWVEESLPPETILLGLMAADPSRRKDQAMTPSEVLTAALPQEAVLQFGGKATIGRGRCRILTLAQGDER